MSRILSGANRKSGFTLIEVLIFAAIFVLIMTSLITVLVTITRVQVRQTGAAEVNQQSQSLLQTLQYYIAQASVVQLYNDTPTSTLKLRVANTAYDPTFITLQGNTVYLQQTSTGTLQALTSAKVNVSSLLFTKHANPPGHDSVGVAFTMTYNTGSLQQGVVQSLETSLTRASAATFDFNVIPAANNTYDLGVSSQAWRSVNSEIYFSSNNANVGIGISTPGQTLEVNGGVRLNTSNASPTCAAVQRGTFWVVESPNGTKDGVVVCVKNAADAYIWNAIY